MSRGRRYDDARKLNIKKVIATIIAIIVLIMFIISIKKLLTSKPKTKNAATMETYFPVYTNGKWGVINNKGNTILDIDQDEMVIIPDKNKDLFICTYDINYENETFQTKVFDKNKKEILTNYKNVRSN